MRLRFCSLFRRPRKPEPSPARMQAPERLNDWQREVEQESRRAANIRILRNIERREAAARRAALPWWRQ